MMGGRLGAATERVQGRQTLQEGEVRREEEEEKGGRRGDPDGGRVTCVGSEKESGDEPRI